MIKRLKKLNRNSDFTLDGLTIDISNKIESQFEDNIGEEIDEFLDKKSENYKKSKIRKYIEDKIEFFPYKQKKSKKE